MSAQAPALAIQLMGSRLAAEQLVALEQTLAILLLRYRTVAHDEGATIDEIDYTLQTVERVAAVMVPAMVFPKTASVDILLEGGAWFIPDCIPAHEHHRIILILILFAVLFFAGGVTWDAAALEQDLAQKCRVPLYEHQDPISGEWTPVTRFTATKKLPVRRSLSNQTETLSKVRFDDLMHLATPLTNADREWRPLQKHREAILAAAANVNCERLWELGWMRDEDSEYTRYVNAGLFSAMTGVFTLEKNPVALARRLYQAYPKYAAYMMRQIMAAAEYSVASTVALELAISHYKTHGGPLALPARARAEYVELCTLFGTAADNRFPQATPVPPGYWASRGHLNTPRGVTRGSFQRDVLDATCAMQRVPEEERHVWIARVEHEMNPVHAPRALGAFWCRRWGVKKGPVFVAVPPP